MGLSSLKSNLSYYNNQVAFWQNNASLHSEQISGYDADIADRNDQLRKVRCGQGAPAAADAVPADLFAVQTLIDRLQDEISDLCAWRESAIAERDFSNERAGMYRRYAESTLAAIGNCQEA